MPETAFPEPDYFVVASYDVDRVYGGPEEGGWWYTSYELRGIVGGADDETTAYDIAAKLRGRDASEYLAVIGLGRWELTPELKARLCCYFDDHQEQPSDYVRRWDVPEYMPEHRPHYC